MTREIIKRREECIAALRHLIDAVDNDMTRKCPDSFPGIGGAIALGRSAIENLRRAQSEDNLSRMPKRSSYRKRQREKMRGKP